MKALILTGLAAGLMTASSYAHGGFRVALGCGPGVYYAPPPPVYVAAPVYVQQPVYVAPPVVYAPPPVVVAPAPVCYAPPPPVVYAPAPVMYRPCRPHFSIRIGF